jgi:RNA polymerase sigma-70 factor (ECF subfamily)
MMNAADPTWQFVGRHFGEANGALIRYLERKTRCRARAEDLAQVAWLKVLAAAQRGVRPPTRSALRAYLFTIARNAFIDECTRKHDTARTRSLDPATLEAIESPGDAGDPERQLQHVQTRELVARTVQALPQAQRDVVLMWAAGTSIKAMAQKSGAPSDTVLSRKKYAFARMRSELGALAESLGGRPNTLAGSL